MTTWSDKDEALWNAMESGQLEPSLAGDVQLAKAFRAHQELESLFELLRRPPEPPVEGEHTVDHPTAIGRYLVRRVLGRGTFGVVYLAEDPDLDRPAAIKVPRPHRFSSESDAERFLEEAKLAAQLKHPGIVTVYDVGREGTLCYIVMEYVQGQSLQELIAAKSYSPDESAELVAQVADALHYAHKKGFVHRDLKPANILIDDQGHPHITDFGLAVSEGSQRQYAGQVAGTPAYMSPEQVRGETQYLDGRTDIWGLGVVLYELLTGRHPFVTETSDGCLEEILQREPKPPRQISEDIPSFLEEICLRCLSKDITNRFPTAADAARALRGSPVDSVSSGPRRYAWWLLACAMCAALVVGLVNLPDGPSENRRKTTRAANATKLSPDTALFAERPEILSLLQLVYDDALEGSSSTAWIQVEKRDNGDSTERWRPLENGSSLSRDDRYRIMLRAPEQTYFYVFQIDTLGQVDWVFPKNSVSAYSSGSNPIPPNTTVKVPDGEGTMFFLDEHTGIEHLYIVATREQWRALEVKLENMVNDRTPLGTAPTPVETPLGLRMRGIGGITSDDGGGPFMVTGIDGVLAREIWFYHVGPPSKTK